jgi:hypothetical protein
LHVLYRYYLQTHQCVCDTWRLCLIHRIHMLF